METRATVVLLKPNTCSQQSAARQTPARDPQLPTAQQQLLLLLLLRLLSQGHRRGLPMA